MDRITLRDLKDYIEMAEERGLTDASEVRVYVKASDSEGGYISPPASVGTYGTEGDKFLCISARVLDEDMIFELLKDVTGIN